MRQVNIHEAKTHFSELIAAVERGEEITIARRGKPIAKLSLAEADPAAARPKPRFGLWKGKGKILPSFYEPMSEDELAEWESPIEGFEELSKSTPKGSRSA
jgi:prevent-host-death family protein